MFVKLTTTLGNVVYLAVNSIEAVRPSTKTGETAVFTANEASGYWIVRGTAAEIVRQIEDAATVKHSLVQFTPTIRQVDTTIEGEPCQT